MDIESTSDALTFLYSLSLDDSTLRFRGQSNHDWTLRPSIYRFSDFQRYQTVDYESNVLQKKPRVPQPPLTHTTYDLEWLMLCQHYGVPTRLLDGSSDILVSLYFAISSKTQMNSDGALFVCNQNDYPAFAAYNEHAMETQELAFVSTNIINPRMRTQSGSFMIWGHSPLTDKTTETYDLWEYHQSVNNTPFLQKLRIPSDAKPKILDELAKIYSINNESVYLENGFLETQYSKKFDLLREQCRLMTLYKTDADSLTSSEEKTAKSFFRIECRNMIGNTVNLRKIT